MPTSFHYPGKNRRVPIKVYRQIPVLEIRPKTSISVKKLSAKDKFMSSMLNYTEIMLICKTGIMYYK